jgi:hypothetical protein
LVKLGRLQEAQQALTGAAKLLPTNKPIRAELRKVVRMLLSGGGRLGISGWSEKDTKLVQKLGQLQPLSLYSRRSAWANLHLLGQPN